VTADPVPDDLIFLHDRQSAVAESDARRIDVNFTFQFLELKTGMRRIAQKETIGAFRVPLRVDCRLENNRQTAGWFETASKQVVYRQRLAPRVFLKGFSCHTLYRIAFSAKLLFQASSSASDARICDAIASCSS